jgi:hypothetical protein
MEFSSRAIAGFCALQRLTVGLCGRRGWSWGMNGSATTRTRCWPQVSEKSAYRSSTYGLPRDIKKIKDVYALFRTEVVGYRKLVSIPVVGPS